MHTSRPKNGHMYLSRTENPQTEHPSSTPSRRSLNDELSCWGEDPACWHWIPPMSRAGKKNSIRLVSSCQTAYLKSGDLLKRFGS